MRQTPADQLIDGRGLEPPEPFVLTMEALDTLAPQQKLRLLLTREPHPLYQALQSRGFAHQSVRQPDGTVDILIWRPAP